MIRMHATLLQIITVYHLQYQKKQIDQPLLTTPVSFSKLMKGILPYCNSSISNMIYVTKMYKDAQM